MVFTPSSPPPPPTYTQQVAQADCKYSAKVAGSRDAPVYQCFSQEEWDARSAQISADNEREKQQTREYFTNELPRWWGENLWKVVLHVFGALAIIIIIGYISESIEKKRHPERFDRFGNKRKDWYW